MKNIRYDNLNKLNDKQFRRAVGVKREIFEFHVAILEDSYKEKHKNGGRNSKLTRQDMLLLTYSYYKDCITSKT